MSFSFTAIIIQWEEWWKNEPFFRAEGKLGFGLRWHQADPAAGLQAAGSELLSNCGSWNAGERSDEGDPL